MYEFAVMVTLDPILSKAIEHDLQAGNTADDLETALVDIGRVMASAALRGDAFSEKYIGDILKKYR